MNFDSNSYSLRSLEPNQFPVPANLDTKFADLCLQRQVEMDFELLSIESISIENLGYEELSRETCSLQGASCFHKRNTGVYEPEMSLYLAVFPALVGQQDSFCMDIA
jgi:hypothetical protein